MQKILPIAKPVNQVVSPIRRQNRRPIQRYAGFITLMILLALWKFVTVMEIFPPFILPAPEAVFSKFRVVLEDGRLWLHTRTTLIQVLAGLASGVVIGTALGYSMAKSQLLEDLLSPLVITFQATPVVAYAPLLVIWFGSGMQSKVVTSALIVFFPMLMNTVAGIRAVPQDLRDLMRVCHATRWQILTKLEIPAALPILLTGFKTSATLAVIGAVVGEFIAAKSGLGYLINVARSGYDTPLVFVAVLTLTFMAGMLYAMVTVLERRLLAWQKRF